MAHSGQEIIKGEISVQTNGILWIIEDFSQISDEKIFSESFQIPENGYTFRLILHPKGDRHARNNYMSLYFQILRNDNIDELSWPLKEKLVLEVVNQTKGFLSKPCQKIYSYDECHRDDRDVFQKPLGKDNTCFGSSEFIPISDLLELKYVVMDSICISFGFDKN